MPQPTLQAGFARREITPEVGIFLAGNGAYQSEAVRDPLFVRALVCRQADQWTALVSCDLIGIDRESVQRVRDGLKCAGFASTEHVFVSCTHTHNGPHTRFIKADQLPHRDEAYLARVEHAIVSAIIEADRAAIEVTMRYARGIALENFNRRMITPDGAAHFYNPPTLRKRPELAELVGGVTDPELDAIQLVKPDGKILLTLVHYAAHPLTVGVYANVISRDFCGPLVDRLEAHYEAPAIFFQGACGNLHCRGLFAGYQRQQEMADRLADETIRILEDPAAQRCEPELAVAVSPVELPVDRQRVASGGWSPVLLQDSYAAEIGAVALGPIAFTTSPGEMCCELGLQIKWHAPFVQTWILYNCNACCGYFSVPRIHAEGGYEGDWGTFLTPEAGQIIASMSLKLCRGNHQRLHGGRGHASTNGR